MKTLLLDVENEKVEVIDIEPELSEFYRVLNCDCIDIVRRCINGKWFDVMCDDEGLLKDHPKWSALCGSLEVMLVGNLLFLHHDDEGNPFGLDDDEIRFLKSQILMISVRGQRPYPILTDCEYFQNSSKCEL